MASRPMASLEQLIVVLFINLKQLFCSTVYVFVLSVYLPNRRKIIIPSFISNAVWTSITVYKILKIISHQNKSCNHFQMLIYRWRSILVSIDKECVKLDGYLNHGIDVAYQPIMITVVIPICRGKIVPQIMKKIPIAEENNLACLVVGFAHIFRQPGNIQPNLEMFDDQILNIACSMFVPVCQSPGANSLRSKTSSTNSANSLLSPSDNALSWEMIAKDLVHSCVLRSPFTIIFFCQVGTSAVFYPPVTDLSCQTCEPTP